MVMERQCYLCNAAVDSRFAFCKACSKKYGLFKKPRALWPEWALRLVRALDLEWKTRANHQHVETDTEEGEHVVRRQSYRNYHRDQFVLPLDVVLYKYHLTLDEYDILTETPRLLAPRMGVCVGTIKNRRCEIKKRILAEGILKPTTR